jgi:hypothetical protein
MYKLNLADKNLYASLEDDAQILKVEQSEPSWSNTGFSETNLAPFVAYDNGEEKEEEEEEQVVPQPVEQPTDSSQTIQSEQIATTRAETIRAETIRAETTKAEPTKSKPKRSVWGFIKFALIVILLALIIYFTIYRIGWGVTECAKRNYHDCTALLTPELSAIALTSIAL